jgi:hypothetical protein
VRHINKSCDLRSLTSSSAHSRAPGNFPALIAQRRVAFLAERPGRYDRRLMRCALLLVQRFRRATNLNRQRSRPQRLSVPATAVPLSRMLAETAAELATARSVEEAAPPTASRVAAQPTRAEPTRLCLDRAAYLIQVGVPVPAPRSSPRAASARFGRGASAGPPATPFRQPPPAHALGVAPPFGRGSSRNRRRHEVGSLASPVRLI